MKKIPLTQGKEALVDDVDFEAVVAFKWFAHKTRRKFRAARRVQKRDGSWGLQLLHQFLIPGVPGVDHRDNDSLNNQRYNLRPATTKQNGQASRMKGVNATSRFRGVSWHASREKWLAQIIADGKPLFLGRFISETDAALAYDSAARKYFGDFAAPNFPSITT